MMLDALWEQTHREKQWGIWPCEHLIRFVKSKDWPQPRLALDLGCGAGAQTAFLQREGFAVVPIDGATTARASFERNPFLMEKGFVCSEFSDLYLAEGVYDLVVDICSLQHTAFDEAASVVQRARKWLKIGGWFYAMMATDEHALTYPISPRPTTVMQIDRMFKGYDWRIGTSTTVRPDGRKIEHWLIEARNESDQTR